MNASIENLGTRCMDSTLASSGRYWKAQLLGAVGLLCLVTSGFTSCGDGTAPHPAPVEVEVDTVEWTIRSGDTTPISRTVGVEQLPGLAAAVVFPAAPVGWLTAEIVQDGATFVVLLTASAQALEPGNYPAEVHVSADRRIPGIIEVILTVTP